MKKKKKKSKSTGEKEREWERDVTVQGRANLWNFLLAYRFGRKNDLEFEKYSSQRMSTKKEQDRTFEVNVKNKMNKKRKSTLRAREKHQPP